MRKAENQLDLLEIDRCSRGIFPLLATLLGKSIVFNFLEDQLAVCCS
jgi:hypothetical protein